MNATLCLVYYLPTHLKLSAFTVTICAMTDSIDPRLIPLLRENAHQSSELKSTIRFILHLTKGAQQSAQMCPIFAHAEHMPTFMKNDPVKVARYLCKSRFLRDSIRLQLLNLVQSLLSLAISLAGLAVIFPTLTLWVAGGLTKCWRLSVSTFSLSE